MTACKCPVNKTTVSNRPIYPNMACQLIGALYLGISAYITDRDIFYSTSTRYIAESFRNYANLAG